jgi:drug/metabolite transporter (DMT)-like permease
MDLTCERKFNKIEEMKRREVEGVRNLPNEKKSTALPLVMAAAGHIIWGFSFLFSKVAQQTATAQVFLSMRFILAFLMLSLIGAVKKEKLHFRGRKWLPLIALCITEPLYFYCETFGIYYTNATFAGVILAVVPVVSMAVSALLLKEYPTRRQKYFCILPVLGVIIMTAAGQEMGIIQPVGVVLLICCCLLSALYKTANRGSSGEFSTFERTYYVIAVCMVVFTIDAFRTVDFSLLIRLHFHIDSGHSVLNMDKIRDYPHGGKSVTQRFAGKPGSKTERGT